MTVRKENSQNQNKQQKKRISRRQFIKSSAAGAAAIYMAPTLTLGADQKSRVVIVKHNGLINADEAVDAKNARISVDKALLELTQKDSIKDAWQNIFPDLKPEDTIGMKVNCINRKCPSHPELTYAIAESLMDSLPVKANNIIIWDRSTAELKKIGYTINESDKGIRCFGTIKKFSGGRWILNQKQDEKGAIGYDKENPIDVGAGVTSHLSRILNECTYQINIPVLKDHRYAGVTLSLKNHFGSIDNPRDCHPNNCDPYTAKINTASVIKDKTKLIICDAAYGVYEGGPRGAPQWKHKSILAAIDPVALDYTGMNIINAKRKENSEDPVTARAVHIKTADALGLGT
ncbi:MAG: DUF362 domain-containing protein, partial [Desulfobacteraceae bacterium]|nr:DUF362 domain-containing protein [Desulfobacteraceae bacterium]